MTSVKRVRQTAVHDAIRLIPCGLQRTTLGFVATCALVLMSMGAAPRAAAPPPLSPPFGTSPLPRPHVLTDLYGELRGAHLHAGLDLRAAIGTPVRAPASGWLARVRSSGSGYGRSLYLATSAGDLLVFGHLDAFAPLVAQFVDSAQRASGQYEQDLWPSASRFRFQEGDTIAWSGESGAGPPHLHLEVRHGDFAINPLRAGWPMPDDEAPSIESLVLEPLDDTSTIEGDARAWLSRTFDENDTLSLRGRFRAYVKARDRVGDADALPWSTAMVWRGDTVEARLDSISWAGEMAELDWMVDRGQAKASRGLLLWAPAGWRPRLLRTSTVLTKEAGTIDVAAGSAAERLDLITRDIAGNESCRSIWVKGEPQNVAGQVAAKPLENPDPSAGAWLGLPGDPSSSRLSGTRVPDAFRYAETSVRLEAPSRRLRDGDRIGTTPAVVPLRRALRLVIDVGPDATAPGWGLLRRAYPGASAEWLSVEVERETGRLTTEVSRLGAFTLVRDTLAPSIGTARVIDRRLRVPYSRWSIELPVGDALSGIDARNSYLSIDGTRVASEYDGEARVLRWRPLERPKQGAILVEAVVTDRAGRSRRYRSRLVLDSASRR